MPITDYLLSRLQNINGELDVEINSKFYGLENNFKVRKLKILESFLLQEDKHFPGVDSICFLQIQAVSSN